MLKAHKGQVDKGGKAYIFHPINVAMKVKGMDSKIVALLHDVAEDTKYEIKDMEFLENKHIKALRLLNHDKETPYMDYIESVKGNRLAKAVKISDLQHNMDLKRIDRITQKDMDRVQKYKNALKFLKRL